MGRGVRPWFFGPCGFVLANIGSLGTAVPEKRDWAWPERRTTCAAAVVCALRSTQPHRTPDPSSRFRLGRALAIVSLLDRLGERGLISAT